jgi:hypothetical protein
MGQLIAVKAYGMDLPRFDDGEKEARIRRVVLIRFTRFSAARERPGLPGNLGATMLAVTVNYSI